MALRHTRLDEEVAGTLSYCKAEQKVSGEQNRSEVTEGAILSNRYCGKLQTGDKKTQNRSDETLGNEDWYCTDEQELTRLHTRFDVIVGDTV